MRAYLLRRLVAALVVLLIVINAVFLMLHLPRFDEARATLGPAAPAWLLADFRVANGLNRSLPVQYWYFIDNLFAHLRLAATHSLPQRVDSAGFVVG